MPTSAGQTQNQIGALTSRGRRVSGVVNLAGDRSTSEWSGYLAVTDASAGPPWLGAATLEMDTGETAIVQVTMLGAAGGMVHFEALTPLSAPCN
jgi:hypothetical protein